ncbi:MAG TPA: hypothetical protein VGA37_11970 [Gemmatimonadales bacterium]
MSPSAILAPHAALPLALLETVRILDAPHADGLDEFHGDLSTKRLGLSRTVAAQIERFGSAARANRRVGVDELVALLRLVARRPDADLVFTHAGRRAGRLAGAHASPVARVGVRLLPGGMGRRLGRALIRRQAAHVIGTVLRTGDGQIAATISEAPWVSVIGSDAACAFFGSALAELCRLYSDFDGAMLHVECLAHGGGACVWQSSPLASVPG